MKTGNHPSRIKQLVDLLREKGIQADVCKRKVDIQNQLFSMHQRDTFGYIDRQ